ncbi:hypothetical protein [Piscirickettsia litoralis]|uniref:Histidine kinase n=1 Tax=Piscirickettsia litoralis TaxID=1891921 RepID=A0ABX3A032_9GAMM|nr:hypothetical protein [Piscirickettsia litoralis]ODN42221.1 hypothetical protein BGC07_03810 [Piscirickettsia litoralis]
MTNDNHLTRHFKKISDQAQLDNHSLTTDLKLVLCQLERRISEKDITLTEAYALINQAEYIVEASLR